MKKMLILVFVVFAYSSVLKCMDWSPLTEEKKPLALVWATGLQRIDNKTEIMNGLVHVVAGNININNLSINHLKSLEKIGVVTRKPEELTLYCMPDCFDIISLDVLKKILMRKSVVSRILSDDRVPDFNFDGSAEENNWQGICNLTTLAAFKKMNSLGILSKLMLNDYSLDTFSKEELELLQTHYIVTMKTTGYYFYFTTKKPIFTNVSVVTKLLSNPENLKNILTIAEKK